MSGLDQLRARAAALRWAADLVDTCDPCDAPAFLRGVADATEAALQLVTPDYPDPEAEPPVEAEGPAEVEDTADNEKAAAADDAPADAFDYSTVIDEIGPFPMPAPAPATKRRRGRPAAPPLTEQQVAEMRRLANSGATMREAAAALGIAKSTVANKASALSIRFGRARSVALPNPAERQAAEDAAAAEVADADIATIRAWLSKHGGLEMAEHVAPAIVATHANQRRRELGLTPFRLVKNPLSALSAAELAAMQRAGEAKP